MPVKIPRLLWIALPLAYLVYLFHLSATGLLGPDEPRYAFIAREMAHSGDWVTPRLWGDEWFEKPALLYWMAAAAFRIGIPADLAPRLPVALCAIAFLAFYWWILNREFGCRVAWMAALILGTSGLWVGYSQVGVTDVPLTATYSAAMLLALPWVGKRDTRYLPASAALFALATLAKGLVPLPLAAPLILGRHVRDWLRLRVIAPFVLIALPWYVLCYARNGWPFLHELFVVHTFSRITSTQLMHVQRWWYYVPVLLAGLLPWTPLLAFTLTRKSVGDRRRQFLAAWVVTVVIAFSVSINKLPGYILPALPAAVALVAIRLDEVRSARWVLALCGVLLAAFPIAGRLLPAAVLSGLSQAPRLSFEAGWLIGPAAAILAWELDRRGRRLAAVAAIAMTAGLCVAWLKSTAAPVLDRSVSSRVLWHEIEPQQAGICLGPVKRDWDYGLAYYAGSRLPTCAVDPRPLELVPAGDGVLLQAKP
jgi:4-amino-4-deoxy-L-arabinose transferase-like glycosyltransferase